MDGTIQSLPFLDLPQHVTWHLGDRPCQHDGIKHPPGNDAIERQAALQALTCRQLALFDAAATFQNPMPDLNLPLSGFKLHINGLLLGGENLMAMTNRIEINPKIMLGKPVVRGTRIPVELLLRKLSEGATESDLFDAYPRLSREDIRAAMGYAADTLAHEETILLTSSDASSET
jgi:uncharacterized protein (DUF433 family)